MEWIYDCRNLDEVREQIDRLDRSPVRMTTGEFEHGRGKRQRAVS